MVGLGHGYASLCSRSLAQGVRRCFFFVVAFVLFSLSFVFVLFCFVFCVSCFWVGLAWLAPFLCCAGGFVVAAVPLRCLALLLLVPVGLLPWSSCSLCFAFLFAFVCFVLFSVFSEGCTSSDILTFQSLLS